MQCSAAFPGALQRAGDYSLSADCPRGATSSRPHCVGALALVRSRARPARPAGIAAPSSLCLLPHSRSAVIVPPSAVIVIPLCRHRHPRGGGDPVLPELCAQRALRGEPWIPAFAGMTNSAGGGSESRRNDHAGSLRGNDRLEDPRSDSTSAYSCSRNRCASSAAMQPVPALVMACRYTWSCTSPAAKTPGTLVMVAMPCRPDLVTM